MAIERIYLDHLATTPLLAAAREAMLPFLQEEFGLPMGLYREGARAGRAVARAREQLAAMIGAKRVDEIIFTSNGSEACNLALKGLAFKHANGGKRHIVSSLAEHPAVAESLKFLEKLGWKISRVGVDVAGFVDPAEIGKVLRPDTLLVATHLSNHDSGAVQSVKEIARLAHANGSLVFCDAMTAGGWLAVSVGDLDVDLLSLSPHRFFGPKGVGVLYKRSLLALESLIHGGKQEDGQRAGSLNVAAIVGAGVAAEQIGGAMADYAAKCRALTKILWENIEAKVPQVKLNGPPVGANRDPRHLNVSFEGIEGEALMLWLDLNGISVAANTGCATQTSKLSPTLMAMGLSSSLAAGSILLSPSPEQTPGEMVLAAEKIAKGVAKIRSL
ncbi:MAG: aminotransferase class V-fold PLP-dependent enzyme [Verrucomicrobiales bacterium]|jgi:cysteine desulfurase|nr:aminotransferase class V-fold PLP-dependent enzyme [Verrucomicrobiales bacterium]